MKSMLLVLLISLHKKRYRKLCCIFSLFLLYSSLLYVLNIIVKNCCYINKHNNILLTTDIRFNGGGKVNAKEVGKILGLHPNTIYNGIREGTIPATKKGREWIVSDDWVNSVLSKEKR